MTTKPKAETALAVVAPEVALPAIAADKVSKAAVEVLTGDIVVVHTWRKNPKSTKKHPLPDMQVDYHVNIAAIGIGAFLLALGALAITVAWNGFGTLGGGLIGLSESRPGGGGTGGGGGHRGDGGPTDRILKGTSLACQACRALGFLWGAAACAACAAGL